MKFFFISNAKGTLRRMGIKAESPKNNSWRSGNHIPRA